MDNTDKARVWRHRTGELALGCRTLLMGVVNVTPDSFSDGGRFLAPAAAASHALSLQDAGADVLDLGAESSRPGSSSVPAADQLARLLPVLERLWDRVNVPLSIDTTSPIVAAECLAAGASVINDITGFHGAAELSRVCAEAGAGVVLMHLRGNPQTMQADTVYADLIGEVRGYLIAGVETAAHAGIPADRVLVDPGLGFGKSFEQNYQLLGALRQFQDLAAGVLAGPSRKAFTGEFSGLPAAQRQYSTAAAVALAALFGADMVRVHDVGEMKQVVQIIDRFREIHGNTGK